MIPRRDLSKAATRDRVPEKTVEKDYAIHWLMAGLSRTALHDQLAFKGGTALRLCRFESYRYSEDVDLTALEPVEKEAAFAAFPRFPGRLARRRPPPRGAPLPLSSGWTWGGEGV